MPTPFPQLADLSGSANFQPLPKPVPAVLGPPKDGGSTRKRVFLTTVNINDDQIWANGLFQNVYILYRLMDLIGYEPYLMVDNLESNKNTEISKKFRMLDFKTYIQNPFHVVAYMEFGMSCDPLIRKFFRGIGAKVSKTYLGNILNIDIETITFAPTANFSHHIAGEIDEIWTSPHYDFHADYTGSVNGLCGKTRIAPYVWEPFFIADAGEVYETPAADHPRKFVIMEPNISFQKNSLVAIMAVEAYYRRHPNKVDHCIVINGNKLKDVPYFALSVLPNLRIFRDGKLQLMPRAYIKNLARVYKDAIVVQHQVNNEYNYSFLEFASMGFPIVHNHRRLKDFGYYYDRNDFEMAADQIEKVVSSHHENSEQYRSQFKQLAWRFSIYNPENIRAWEKLITDR
jgi:hypothetical protein